MNTRIAAIGTRLVAIVLFMALIVALATVLVSAATKQELINSVTLSPELTGSDDLNDLVADLIEDLTTDDMDTYAKVKACYDYLVNNITYGSVYDKDGDGKEKVTRSASVSFRRMGSLERMAYSTLVNKAGHCGGFSSAFVVICRAIGLEAYLASGETRAAAGGYTGHKWVEIDIGSYTYVFDPQMEQNGKSWTGSNSYFFCTTYTLDPDRYIFNARTGLTDPDDFERDYGRWNDWRDDWDEDDWPKGDRPRGECPGGDWKPQWNTPKGHGSHRGGWNHKGSGHRR